MKIALACLVVGAALGITLVACGNDGAPGGGDAAADGDSSDGSRACTGDGICGSGFTCSEKFASSSCFGGVCCIPSPDAEPPVFDDAGSCPGQCGGPDDLGCPGAWYRSVACANGDLCCVFGSPDAGDASTD